MICKTNDKHLGIFLRRSYRKAIPQPTSRQTSALLYRKIYSEPPAWKAFLAHCPFKKWIEFVCYANFQSCVDGVEAWAKQKLHGERKDTKTRKPRREQVPGTYFRPSL